MFYITPGIYTEGMPALLRVPDNVDYIVDRAWPGKDGVKLGREVRVFRSLQAAIEHANAHTG